MVSTITAPPSTLIQPVPAALMPLATSVSHGVRIAASCRSSHAPAWSSARSEGPCWAATNAAVRIRTARTSQAVVVMVNGCGSGGGAPVGRR